VLTGGEPVNPDVTRRMDALRSMKRWLDEAFRVPGTPIRFGWDPVIGMVPGFGDLVTALFSSAIILQAHTMRLPRVVILRMLFNVVIDLVVGVVPLFGDVADVFWKSNTKNFALLELHADQVRPPSASDWVFVLAVIAVIVIIALIPLFVLYWLGSMLLHRS
jgi:uncharacterized protein DUF4112